MRAALALMVGMLLSVSGAQAATFAHASFQSGGRSHSLEISKDHVVVRGVEVRVRSALVNEKEAAAFAQMGVRVLARTALKAADVIVGYPVWFDRTNGAVGVLTHEIVVRVANEAARKALAAQTGFLSAHATRRKTRRCRIRRGVLAWR